MVVIKGEGLTFDDVLLLPRPSSINSRKEVDTSTFLTKRSKSTFLLLVAQWILLQKQDWQ